MNVINNAIDAVKKVVSGIIKWIKKIVNIVKFLMTPVGYVVGILILVVVIVIVLAVILKTLSNAFASWFDPEYAGISTDADYEYLVSSIGYAGYDSVISEKDWQEYLAYEYSVLMDVADYLYDGQLEFEEGNGVEENYRKDGKGDKTVTYQAHLPYLQVTHEYDISSIEHSDWEAAVIEGQGSARFGFTSASAVNADPGYTSLGGQTECVPPTISFEFKNNPYDENAGSLVPYISIVKEAIKHHYFTVGGEGDNGGRPNYEEGGKYAKNDANSGVSITQANIGDVNLVEKNDELNIHNEYFYNSTSSAKKLLNLNNGSNSVGSNIVTNTDDNYIMADIAREQNLYSADEYSVTVYKMPLQVLIDRYLPKASLLTSWLMLKDTDYADGDESTVKSPLGNAETVFNVDALMKDIKSIYNYYCWHGETITEETVTTVTYNGNGVVKRDEEGKAETEEASKPYSSTNKETFVKFGQVGLETNRYGVFSLYTVGKVPGPSADPKVTTTGQDDKATIPIITDLLADDAYFLETLQLRIKYDYDYTYSYDETITTKTTTSGYVDKDYTSVTISGADASLLGLYATPTGSTTRVYFSHKYNKDSCKLLGCGSLGKFHSGGTCTNNSSKIIKNSNGTYTIKRNL
ncbi:MAG: hypothetical protein IJ215_05850 [Clostridia bacterium]|nr:hypothetical protein [Clostridia bacterium]